MRLETFCALGLAVLMGTAPVMAQDRVPARGGETFQGERVAVRTGGPRETLRGRLVSFDATALTIDVNTGGGDGRAGTGRLTVPAARLRQMDVVKRDPIWNGALLGAIYLGVCASTWCQQGLDKSASLPGEAILAAGVGALVFGGIDALWVERRTIYKSGGVSGGLGDPGARLSFSIRF